MKDNYDVVIIGAGQAGLALAYYLQKKNLKFIMLEKNSSVGEVWENRYDSLVLLNNIRHDSLPGLNFPGNKNSFPKKAQVVEYLRTYAEYFNFPIIYNANVSDVQKTEKGFSVKSGDDIFLTRSVVVATGAFHEPSIPNFSKEISDNIYQIHSSEYCNPDQLQPGKTLVVGAGNSGAQISRDIVEADRVVYFSYSKKPRQLRTEPWKQWLGFNLGFVHASKKTIFGKFVKKLLNGVVEGIDLDTLLEHKNLFIVGKTLGVKEGVIQCSKSDLGDVKNIIWCTGYRSQFNFIDFDIFDNRGVPNNKRGVTDVEGLYFLGLPDLWSRGSSLLGGVWKDARFISKELFKNLK